MRRGIVRGEGLDEEGIGRGEDWVRGGLGEERIG